LVDTLQLVIVPFTGDVRPFAAWFAAVIERLTAVHGRLQPGSFAAGIDVRLLPIVTAPDAGEAAAAKAVATSPAEMKVRARIARILTAIRPESCGSPGP
jgi:hypothetical protein